MTVFTRLNAPAFNFFPDSSAVFFLKLNLFLANSSMARVLKVQATDVYALRTKDIVINRRANFQSLFKLIYRILSSCFEYIPLSFDCTNINIVTITRKINYNHKENKFFRLAQTCSSLHSFFEFIQGRLF